jgi:two-component system, response regulator
MNMNKIIPVEVLLVEDNPRDVELTIRAFRKNNLANNLHRVEDGVEALDFLFHRGRYSGLNALGHPKVVLLDLKLPKMGGLEVLRILRADEKTRNLPVVVVTSSAQDPDIKAAYDLGANGYVVKPVDFESFMDAMAKLGFFWLLVNHPPIN